MKAEGRKIEFVGYRIAESTVYFFVVILNFIFIPIIEMKNLINGPFPIFQIQNDGVSFLVWQMNISLSGIIYAYTRVKK